MPKFIRLTKKGRMIKKRSYKRKMGMRKSRKNVGGDAILCQNSEVCPDGSKCINGYCKKPFFLRKPTL